MNKFKRSLASGFTIIEVVLVLAIAGLIFLMVFYVFPTAQTSQRDVQRRQDMSAFSSAVISYQNNNSTKRNNLPGAGTPSTWNAQTDNGIYPADCSSNPACRFVRDYLNINNTDNVTKTSFNDPDGIPYSLVITNNYATTETGETGLSCNGTSSTSCPFKYDNGGYNLSDAKFEDRAIYLVPGGKCNGETVTQSTVRHFAVVYKLEGSGTYCLDDQRTVSD